MLLLGRVLVLPVGSMKAWRSNPCTALYARHTVLFSSWFAVVVHYNREARPYADIVAGYV